MITLALAALMQSPPPPVRVRPAPPAPPVVQRPIPVTRSAPIPSPIARPWGIGQYPKGNPGDASTIPSIPRPMPPSVPRRPVLTAPPPPAPPPPPPGSPVPNQERPPVPRSSPESWVAMPDDYPAEALQNEEEGTARFRLNVGTNGRVDSCQITGSSGSSALDMTTCILLQERAVFIPARDMTGRTVTGSYSASLRWQLPD